jgi:NTP pyrophosphatase (non-canonical NTP hydrolase)
METDGLSSLDTPNVSLDITNLRTLRIFFDRNYTSPPETIYMHLSEVMGGLSLLSTSKRKSGFDPREYVLKALAWWFALCAKHQVASVERLLWSKFPGMCPYCLRIPHDSGACEKKRKIQWEPEWQELSAIAKETWASRGPRKLGEWQQHFESIYPTPLSETHSYAVGRLVEEMGELAESIRTYAVAQGHFLSEAADVFAWIMKIQNISDRQEYSTGSNISLGIDEAFWRAYPGKCVECNSQRCVCPAMLRSTIGRISEGPTDSQIIGPIFGSQRALIELFSVADRAPKTPLDQKTLQLLSSGVRQLVLLIEAAKSEHGREIEESREQFRKLEDLALQSLNGTAATAELVKIIQSQPSERRYSMLQFLMSVESSLFATELVALLGPHIHP